MDENGLPITGAGINYTSVKALNQRELVTYFNMFLVRTCSFLNNFSTNCESKLAKLHARLDKIDTSITLLETKLNSVEELKDMKQEAAPVSTPASQGTASGQVEAAPQAQNTEAIVAVVAAAPPPPPEVPITTVSQDQRYSGYFKMLKLGVLPDAIKMKMRAEGVNPDLLDTPDAPAPPPDPTRQTESSDDDE